MRGETENRAEKYIRNHNNHKKWLTFVLCLSLLTGTITLYGMNKPATAMTEEGAGQVGLVLETADDEFEQGLIEQMESEEESNLIEENIEENDIDLEDGLDSDIDVVTEGGAVSGNDDEIDEASAFLASTLSDDSEEAATTSLSSDEVAAEASSLSSKTTTLDIPDAVNLADYVTETIIERLNEFYLNYSKFFDSKTYIFKYFNELTKT